MKSILFILASIFILVGCSDIKINPNYESEILAYRAEKDSFFRFDPSSPFKRDPNVKYTGLKYFDINADFIFNSKLYKYAIPETVEVYGTKGEQRKYIKYGYFLINYKRKSHKLNVYKYRDIDIKTGKENLKNYLIIWFRDLTTGDETYEVGRYLDIEEESPDPEHIYTIDFNKAYNPYCAYTPLYSCAIPREEDFLNIRIKAGEKKYHK